MSKLQIPVTAVYLTEDATLQTGQEYRILSPGLKLTVPACEPDEYIIVEPLVDQRAAATKLLAPASTIDGENADVSLSTNTRTVLRCSIANAWIKI